MTVEQIGQKISEMAILLAQVEARSKSNEDKIEDHSEQLKENITLITAIKELAVETKYMREDLNKTVSRLDKLETKDAGKWEALQAKDADKWNNFMWLLFSTVVGLALGYIAFKFGLK